MRVEFGGYVIRTEGGLALAYACDVCVYLLRRRANDTILYSVGERPSDRPNLSVGYMGGAALLCTTMRVTVQARYGQARD